MYNALQEQQVRPVGGESLVSVDVRVIAATLRDLEKDVQNGRFRDDLMFPYPLQDEADRQIGDSYIAEIRAVLEELVDADTIDETGEIPQEAIDALAKLGAFGMKIPKEYGGRGLSQVNYSRICAYIGSYCASTGAPMRCTDPMPCMARSMS